MSLADNIDTLVIVMMENRSFDHMLGYRSLTGADPKINGLRTADLPSYANLDPLGNSCGVFPFPEDIPLPADIPHDRNSVALQMKGASETFRMHGFVKAYCQSLKPPLLSIALAPPMGYFTPPHIPVTDFLANNYCVADHWFTPIPTGTFPNRFIAMSGYSTMEGNGVPSPLTSTVLDWLDHHSVPWRVYCEEFSFFAMIGKYWNRFLHSSEFKRLGGDASGVGTSLETDFRENASFPKVIFVEPSYESIHPFMAPNDNHPPLPVGPGEAFLSKIYRALSEGNPERWKRTLMVVTYDEHGGFFDHVPPLQVPMKAPKGAGYGDWETTGPRVPALLISPQVKKGSVFSKPMDHTSILQSIAAKFAPLENGYTYGSEGPELDIANRGMAQLWEALSDTSQEGAPPRPPAAPQSAVLEAVMPRSASDDTAQSFATQLSRLRDSYDDETLAKFPAIAALPKSVV